MFFVSSKVIEPLAEMDYQTGLRPLLAESWEGSDDGLSYTVHLRPEVAWHDGTPFTSGDVAFSAMQVWKPLQAIGIEVEIVSADPAGHTTAVYTDHDFDLAIGSPVYRNDPAISTTILFQGGLPAGVPFSNQYGYDDPAMNEVIAAAAHEIDPEKRIALYADFQRLAAEELPIVSLVEFTFTTVASDRVKEVSNNPRWATSSWADTWLEA